MNKKGQALVEFIIILPILVMLVFTFIDFAMITYNKIKLENTLNDVVNMINNKDEKEIKEFINIDNKNVDYYVTKKDKYITIHLTKDINIITPGLNIVLDNPYKVKVSRVMYEE